MRTKISYGGKVISFTEGEKIEIETKDHEMLENIVVETADTLEEKTLDITENGTTEITPSSGYDGIGKVTITTNVSSGTGTSQGYITVSSVEELPTDSPDGTIAIVG